MSGRTSWICKACGRHPRGPHELCVVLTHENKLTSPLLSDGPAVYAAHLKMEHSDENVKFWMAHETYKKTASRWSRISQAKKLYKIYIQPQSPREINFDSLTRETIFRNIQEPTETCFEEAQRIACTHLKRDSYPRCLESETYQEPVEAAQ